MATTIIGLTGKKRAGKDTFAKPLVNTHHYTRLAFADPLKDMALQINPRIAGESVRLAAVVGEFGWEGAKDAFPEVRRFIQDLGVAARKTLGDNVWVEHMHQRVWNTPGPVVITDVRFLNEAEYVEEMGGTMVRVVRQGQVSIDTHVSETEMDNRPASVVVTFAEGGHGKASKYADELVAYLHSREVALRSA